ncbi:MAG: zinc-ribbon domain-containing protein [Nitrosopumilaceae archaeon]|nr:zinc-ribbon domain-containing protein [Nitrosopumilaceae archaeon]
MKTFDGKKAAEDYMSTHTLAFSTPELTLMRFAFWLGDTVPDPEDKEKTIPRMMTFMKEQDFEPVVIDDDTYVPTGAVKNTGIYGNAQKESSSESKFCSECGVKISATARFCPECGSTQE